MSLAQFLRNRKGGVAPMLALAAIPLIGAVGAAVDYSRANSTRTAMQAALDSTALMLSRDAQTLSTGALGTKATAYFNALFHRPEALNVQVTPHFSSPQQGSFVLKIDGSAAVNTMFWRLMGQQQVNITASGEVVWGIKKLNLALALDNTGSMASSNKMTALKEAAHNLLNTLQKAEKVTGRHQDLDHPLRGRRQCRHRKRQCLLDRLGRLEFEERHLQQVLATPTRAAACRTAAPGRPTATACGTAA